MAYFNFERPHQLFFPSWTVNSTKDQALLLIGLAILAVLLECLQTISDVAKRKIVNKISKSETSSRFSCEVTETVEYGATLQRVHLTISQRSGRAHQCFTTESDSHFTPHNQNLAGLYVDVSCYDI
ncbi:uncharacterized protein [Apostichopus japonicus]|uniref:uncharacterized protein isoform X2 n=1 Tax=Stichopus japonicus TaxID=307972 RepID=UPI003AB88E9B